MSVKNIIWFIPVMIGLYGCPYEANVPLAARPAEAVDTNLVGYWYGIVKDGSDFFGIEALDISPKTDSTYSIIRYGKAIKGDIILPDTAYFTGYTSFVGPQRFMNIEGTLVIEEPRGKKEKRVTTQKIFYLAALDRAHDTLDIRTVTENFTARKSFGRPEDLNAMVNDLLHNKKQNIFDDQYNLKYRRIPRPGNQSQH
ncbi:MAG: hypothetical protein IPQ08_08050 [Chitinophagaceae bacterium]|nr:hypothetical protein [Chitinophagaceae bacterium]